MDLGLGEVPGKGRSQLDLFVSHLVRLTVSRGQTGEFQVPGHWGKVDSAIRRVSTVNHVIPVLRELGANRLTCLNRLF